MDIPIGSFEFLPATEHTDLLAPPVSTALPHIPNAASIGVVEIDPNLSDTAGFCEHYGMGAEQAANCVIVEGKRGEDRTLAAVVILATTRADVNGIVREFLNARKASFADREKAVTESGMEFGAITPIGLPADWPILIDKAVADSPYVIVGSGVRRSKLAVPGSLLSALPNATIIEGLGQVRDPQ